MEYRVDRTPYYYQLRNTLAKVVIEQGGTSSGKTYTTLQVLFDIAISEKNRVITIVGQDIPNLKKGAYRDAKTIWSSEPHLQALFGKPNETDRTFYCEKTGSLLEFVSFQDEQDAKSGKRDYLFINEANGIPYAIFWQLHIRTKYKTWIDYNPTSRFWAHDMIGMDGVVIFYTDHRNNSFLTEEQHERIENIKDKELWRVYARGMTGCIKGLIYTNWDLVDAMPPEEECKWRVIGMDFGYNDPTAIIDIRFYDGALWLDEICYQSEMLPRDIAQCLHENLLDREMIVADCASPTSIAELKKVYKFKVTPSVKGADSIVHGIQTLQGVKMHITRNSSNIRREVESYKWAEDKSGNPLNKPIDEYNHALDAIRYGACSRLGRPSGGFRAMGNA